MRGLSRAKRGLTPLERRLQAVADRLVRFGHEEMCHPPVVGPGMPAGDAWLLDISERPHAFVLGCALAGSERDPGALLQRLSGRLGHFDVNRLAILPAGDLVSALARPAAIARAPERAASIILGGAARILREYHGDAARIWLGIPASATIVRRLLEFEGVSREAAVAGACALVRDHRIKVSDRSSLDLTPDAAVVRVMARLGLLDEGASRDSAIYVAREISPDFPAVVESCLVEIARTVCRSAEPQCRACGFADVCHFATTTRSAENPRLPFAAGEPDRGDH